MTKRSLWDQNPPDGSKSTLGPTPIRGRAARLIRNQLVLDRLPRGPSGTEEEVAGRIADVLIKAGLLPDERLERKKEERAQFRLVTGPIKDLARRSGVLFEELPKRHAWTQHLNQDELIEFAHELAHAQNASDVEMVTAQWHNTADINADPVLHGILSTPVAD